ncbi:MAG TPA: hypothetical protein PLW39_07915 [Thermoflexales bacterium]|nr:hypothetical protein [Thermoflexales bacterium]HQW34026.1 hypothetical protein [Thermoflexales bacterium]HQZ22177.1 hypothetical protein [Thermoflexales bacterium]
MEKVSDGKWISRAALRGGLVGVVLALAYVFIIVPIFGLLITVVSTPGSQFGESLKGMMAFSMCAIPFGVVIGIVPGGILGLIGGFVTGTLTSGLRQRLTRRLGAVAGMLSGVVVVVAVNLFLWLTMMANTEMSMTLPAYLFWVGLPGLVLIGGMAYLGWWLAREEVGAAGAKA